MCALFTVKHSIQDKTQIKTTPPNTQPTSRFHCKQLIVYEGSMTTCHSQRLLVKVEGVFLHGSWCIGNLRLCRICRRCSRRTQERKKVYYLQYKMSEFNNINKNFRLVRIKESNIFRLAN
jgi:hypothetical protein